MSWAWFGMQHKIFRQQPLCCLTVTNIEHFVTVSFIIPHNTSIAAENKCLRTPCLWPLLTLEHHLVPGGGHQPLGLVTGALLQGLVTLSRGRVIEHGLEQTQSDIISALGPCVRLQTSYKHRYYQGFV